MTGASRFILALGLLLTLVACGGGDMITTASRVLASPTASPSVSPTATASAAPTATDRPTAPPATPPPPTAPPPSATATATVTLPRPTATATATLPLPTATSPLPTTPPAPPHGQCTFSQPGSFACAIPAGVISISIRATGGGGGGGDACCNQSGGFTGLGGSPAGTESATVPVPASGQTLSITVGSGGSHGQWFGDPAARGGRGGVSSVANAAGSILIQAAGGTGGLYCAGAHKSGLTDGQQVCGNHPAGDGGLGGGCLTGGTDGCGGTGGAVTISW